MEEVQGLVDRGQAQYAKCKVSVGKRKECSTVAAARCRWGREPGPCSSCPGHKHCCKCKGKQDGIFMQCVHSMPQEQPACVLAAGRV